MTGRPPPSGPPPPPPSVSPPPPPRRPRPGRLQWQAVGLLALATIGGAVILAGLVVFAAGEDLFGSDDGSIDAYNRGVLETCDVPLGSTLVRSYVLEVVDDSGRELRTTSFVYASPLPAEQVAAFYQLEGPGIWTNVQPARACQFGNRPSVLVLSLWTPSLGKAFDPATDTVLSPELDDEFWAGKAADISDVADPPADTRSLLRLRLGQQKVRGLFGMGTSR